MASHVYVYYRVVDARDPAARRGVAALLALVKSRTGTEGRRLTKRDDPATWLEIYERIDDPVGFLRILDGAVAETGVEKFVTADSARHVEHFED